MILSSMLMGRNHRGRKLDRVTLKSEDGHAKTNVNKLSGQRTMEPWECLGIHDVSWAFQALHQWAVVACEPTKGKSV